MQNMHTVNYGGGNGYTPENAVIIGGVTFDYEGVDAEYQYLRRKFPGHRVLVQKIYSEDGHFFDVLTIRTIKGDEETLYFDISAFYNRY